MTTLEEVNAERQRILTAMDVDAAKAFLRAHDGKWPAGRLNWERVMHLARFEVTTLPEEERSRSQVWLARHFGTSIAHGDDSREAEVALQLIFPPDEWAQSMAEARSKGLIA